MSFALSHEMISVNATLKKPIIENAWEPLVRRMVDDLLKTLCMEELGPLEFNNHTKGNLAIHSFIQPITTSHMAGYYIQDEGKEMPYLHFDIYTCDGIAIENVLRVVDKYLHLGKWEGVYVRRDIEDSRYIANIDGEGAEISDKNLLPIEEVSTPK